MENNEQALTYDTKVQIDDAVFSSIASLCVTEVDGVSGLTENLGENLREGVAKIFGRGASHKGIRVTTNQAENSVSIDLSVVVKQGRSIPTVASALQVAIKEMVERMTNSQVSSVNVSISGVEWDADLPVKSEE